MILRCSLVAAVLAVVACESSPPDQVLDIPVPDSARWTCSVLCTYDGSSQTYSYTASEPAIIWGFEPPDINGDWKRSRGFAAFPLTGVFFSADRVQSCTLSYYRFDSGPAPTYIRHVYVRVSSTSPEGLYADGANSAMGTDTSGAAGWHHVALNELGMGTIRDWIELGNHEIGYCWDSPESGAAAASACGNDQPRRPYLTIVYSGAND